MPPVEHVALLKLAGSGVQDLVAGDGRLDGEPGQCILELVAEAKGTAGLVKGAAPIEAAGEALVQQPAVEHRVDGGFRRAHLDAPQQVIPVALRVLPGGPRGLWLAVTLRQRGGVIRVCPLPDHKIQFVAGVRRQVQVHLQCAADVSAGRHPGLQAHGAQRSRPRQ